MRWEYLTVEPIMGPRLSDEALNQRGAKGWELVSVLPHESKPKFVYFFKKAMPDPQEIDTSAGN